METDWQLLATVVLAAFLGYEIFSAVSREGGVPGGPEGNAESGIGFGAMTGIPIVAAMIALGAPSAGLSFVLGFLATMLAAAAACGGWLASRRQERMNRNWE